jgi:hypothetical protein
MITVHQLRKAGNRVRITHARRYFDPNTNRWYMLSRFERINSAGVLPKVNPAPHGGKTTIELTTKDGKDIVAVADCSKKDAFNRKAGIELALNRLLNQANQMNVSLP